MTKADLYDNIITSIMKISVDFIAAEAPDATFVDFDAHASMSEFPDGTFIGPAGCGMTINEQQVEVVFAIGVGTNNDPNLFALRKLVSKLSGWLYPQTRLTVYDHDTAAPASWMVVITPQAVTPVSRAELRAVQFVECRALIDMAALSLT